MLIFPQVFKPEGWTGEKEKKFESVCSDIVSLLSTAEQGFTCVVAAKEKKPVMHFICTVISLLCLIYVGNTVNNFFLLYLVTLFVAMLPGLQKRGLLKKYFSEVTLKVGEMVKGKDHMKKAE